MPVRSGLVLYCTCRRERCAGTFHFYLKADQLWQRLELMLGRPYVIDVLGLLADGELDEDEAASLLHCHIDELPEL